MKKIISLLLVVTMLAVGIVTAVPAAAAGEAKITAAGTTDTVTDKVTVTIDLSGNTGLFAARLTLGYNADALTYESTTQGTDVFAKDSMSEVNAKNNPLVIYFENENAANVSSNGKLCTVTFAVKNKTAKYNLSLALDPDSTISYISTAPYYKDFVATVDAGKLPVSYPVTTTAPVTTAPVTTAPVTTAPVTTAPVTTAPDYTYLNDLGDKLCGYVLPDPDAATKEQIAEMAQLIDAVDALNEDEIDYLLENYPDFIDCYFSMNEVYTVATAVVDKDKLNSFIERIDALPAYEDMTEDDVNNMLDLLDELVEFTPDEFIYISYYHFDSLLNASEKVGKYAEDNDIDFTDVMNTLNDIFELPDLFSEMTDKDIEMLLIIDAAIKGFDRVQLAYTKLIGFEEYEKYVKLMADYEASLVKDTTASTTVADTTKATESVPTGDSMITVLAVTFAAAVMSVGVVVVRKKQTSAK